ncbi:signal transduction histidine kinase [Sphingomonas sp. BE138]|uniref:sensor histidine kinase n=1 Tax=Sphingomonas sp. BE138 TaxID=2817845 RepID=UPI00285BC711|nr:sensor histidine kinase [Sphingomonas sp. BE138]MDR6789247.1 signal transduction histidine kinase [Sphingomonas sp. BE138]
MPGFSVDTKLFRELGELLVGRESTALIELIKNAYDADATKVTIFGERLKSDVSGRITIADNGVGMTSREFSSGFLRIAGRSKTSGERRSPWFGRRYTGEKGVGRLAAHKLAHAVGVSTRKWSGTEYKRERGFLSDGATLARIDWDAIEALESISDIDGSSAVRMFDLPSHRGLAGTTLRLAPLRKQWTDRDLSSFFDEVATLTPPRVLIDTPSADILPSGSLLQTVQLRDATRGGDFSIEYAGDLRPDDSDLPAAPESSSWVIEIDCDLAARRLQISVQPTQRTLTEYPDAQGFKVDRPLDAGEPSVSFQARIFQREYESWPARYRGVRVYYEGFRVLPYGDMRDDWLELDRDYRSRGRSELGRLRSRAEWQLPAGREQEGLSVQGNSSFFGAVLLTREGADDLKMLVNREGFLPSDQFDFIMDTVRLAIDLQVRVRYATTSVVKQARRQSVIRQRSAAQRAPSGQAPSAFLLQEIQSDAVQRLQAARNEISAGRGQAASALLDEVTFKLSEASDLTSEVSTEATMFRVVASLGLEHAAFVHEVRSLSITAQTIASTLDDLAQKTANREVSVALKAAALDAREMRERLRRNAVYLADVTGIEGRRRRSRQNFADRLKRVVDFYKAAIERKNIQLSIDVPSDITTPPLFPAELTAIMSNVLSNAIKFVNDGGAVAVRARDSEKYMVVTVENTGQAVDLIGSERFFEPFRSTTVSVDEALGQGMGLGLTITRSLLDEYGAVIRFKSPSVGFATAIEMEIPRR